MQGRADSLPKRQGEPGRNEVRERMKDREVEDDVSDHEGSGKQSGQAGSSGGFEIRTARAAGRQVGRTPQAVRRASNWAAPACCSAGAGSEPIPPIARPAPEVHDRHDVETLTLDPIQKSLR